MATLAPTQRSTRGGNFALPSSPSSTSVTPSALSSAASPAISPTTNGLGINNLSLDNHNSGSYDEDDDDGAPLPFPAALPRADFLAPTFDAAAYLSSLPHRHQTLEDLRSDLRDRGSAIAAELLELVNSNYASFLGLGDSLRGGDDRSGDARVALLGFRRAVDDIRSRVAARRREVSGAAGELRAVREDVETGRLMLELDDRVCALEERLALGSGGQGDGAASDEEQEEDEDEDDEEEEEEEGDDQVGQQGTIARGPADRTAARLARWAADLATAEGLADAIGRDAAFVRKTEERLLRCRNTIVLDLNAALREARGGGNNAAADPRARTRLLRLLAIYAALDAQSDAVKALKGK